MNEDPRRPVRERPARRPPRRATAAAGMAVAVTWGVVGCAEVSGPNVVDGPGQVWSIGVTDPRFATEQHRDDDPSIDTTVMTADLPPSGFGITLVPDATEDEALRIAECLRGAVSSGEITISRPDAP